MNIKFCYKFKEKVSFIYDSITVKIVGFPMVYWYGVEGDYNILIMSILGPNLQQLFEYCGKSFSLKTVLVIGIHLLQRIQHLHSKHFLHRDLKPENILIG